LPIVRNPEKHLRAHFKLLPIAVAWLLGVGVVVFVHFRGQIEPYVSMHRWLAERGIPHAVRNFDSLLWFTVAAFLGAAIAARSLKRSTAGLLCLGRGRPGWAAMVPAALLPMVAGGLALGISRGFSWADLLAVAPDTIPGTVRAPWAEEILFRGLLVAIPAACFGWRGRLFWLNATLAALLFGMTHVDWSSAGVARGWPNLLVTFIGGVWYAWLLGQWQAIWVPMLLHAGMNLGWMLASASGGAGGGGLEENLLRVATIAVATVWTIFRTRPAIP
jgi:membrane protease YdiL (CAAX protease family)